MEKLYDLSQLNAVASGSQEFVDKMIGMFLEMTPEMVGRIQNGMAAEDWDEVKAAAHKMKPSIDMMGITSLHDLIRAIEGDAKNRENLDELPAKVDSLQETLAVVYEQLMSR